MNIDKFTFLKDCTDMELVALQKEARDVGDDELKRAVLVEIGVRVKSKPAEDRTPL